MKPINFIYTPSKKQEREVHYWFLCTIILLCFFFIAILGVQVAQWYLLRQLKNEQQALQLIISSLQTPNTIELHKKENNEWQQKTQKIRKNKQSLSLIFQFLQKIKNLCPSPATIQSCTIQNKTLSLIVELPSVEHASSVIHDLKQIPHIKTIILLSLETKKNIHDSYFVAHFQGTYTNTPYLEKK